MVYDDVNVVNYLTPATFEDLDFNKQEILEYVECDHKKFRNLDVHLGIKQLQVNQHDFLVIVGLYIENNDSEVYFDRDVRITFKAEKSVIDKIITIEQPDTTDDFITSINNLGLLLKGTKPNCYTTLRSNTKFSDIPKLVKTSIDYGAFDFRKTVNGVKTLAPVYEWIKGGRTTEEIVPTITKNSVTIDTDSKLNIPGTYDLTYIFTNDSVNIKKMLHIEIKPIDITVEMETSTQISTEEIAAEIQPDCSVPVIIQARDENDIPIWVNEIVSNTKPDDSYEKKKVQAVQDNLPLWVKSNVRASSTDPSTAGVNYEIKQAVNEDGIPLWTGDNIIFKTIFKPSEYDPLLVQESTSTGKKWIKEIVSNTKPDDDSYKPLMIQKTQDNIPVWLKKS